MSISNRRAIKMLNSMDERGKYEFLITGRVTVARLTHVLDDKLVVHYAPKIRGILLEFKKGDLELPTEQAAHDRGVEMLNKWKQEYQEKYGEK